MPPAAARETPDVFRDLNLDQLIAAVTARFAEYDLVPLFSAPLSDVDAITWRQEVMADLAAEGPADAISRFAAGMRAMRAHLAARAAAHYPREGQRWFLAALEAYVEAVTGLHRDLATLALGSRGLRAVRDRLARYVAGSAFTSLADEGRQVADGLASVRYALRIGDNRITVLPYAGEPDFAAEVAATFDRFRQGAATDYRASLPSPGGLNHVEARVLDGVAQLYPAPFAALDRLCAAHSDFIDPAIARFDREVQFYVAWLAFSRELERAGLAFCTPRLTASAGDVDVRDAFDVALAGRMAGTGVPVVTNGVSLAGPERILVVTGPNHGGKTTFARMVGQLHYLARLGCTVPGTEARLFLCDRIFTHFERAEVPGSQRGKLQDDLLRIRDILRDATARSLVIVNELFASTTLDDALYLGRRIMAQVSARGLVAVFVTFLDELATFDEKTVSVVSVADPHDPARRTFRLERRPPAGVAYALAVAERYRLTYDWLVRRVGA